MQVTKVQIVISNMQKSAKSLLQTRTTMFHYYSYLSWQNKQQTRRKDRKFKIQIQGEEKTVYRVCLISKSNTRIVILQVLTQSPHLQLQRRYSIFHWMFVHIWNGKQKSILKHFHCIFWKEHRRKLITMGMPTFLSDIELLKNLTEFGVVGTSQVSKFKHLKGVVSCSTISSVNYRKFLKSRNTKYLHVARLTPKKCYVLWGKYSLWSGLRRDFQSNKPPWF